MTKSDCYENNLITDDGSYDPFVAKGEDGRIYVGDCDNLESFANVADAIAYANGAIIEGEALDKARAAEAGDYRNNDEAAYHWHCDAKLQIAALEQMQ